MIILILNYLEVISFHTKLSFRIGSSYRRTLSNSSNSNGSTVINGAVTNGTASRKSCLKQPVRSFSMSRAPRSRAFSAQTFGPAQPIHSEITQNLVLPQSLRFDSTCSVYQLSRHESRDISLEGHTDHSLLTTEVASDRVKKTKRRSSTPQYDTDSLNEVKIWWIPKRWKALRDRLNFSYFVFPPGNRLVLHASVSHTSFPLIA